jgi:hypothetical protein
LLLFGSNLQKANDTDILVVGLWISDFCFVRKQVGEIDELDSFLFWTIFMEIDL